MLFSLLGVLLLLTAVSLVRYYLIPAKPLRKTFQTEKGGVWALVTGATSGIGYEFARELAKQGFNVLIVSRSIDKMKEVCKELKNQFHVKADFIQLDMENFPSDSFPVDVFVQEVEDKIKHEKLRFLVCNAGMSDLACHFTDTPLDRQLRIIALNTSANVCLIQSLAKRIFADGLGSSVRPGIITLGAITSMIPAPTFAISSANKSFLRTFTLAAASEFQGDIRFMIAHPVSVYSGILKARELRTAISPDTFVRNSLDAFSKGSLETFGCMSHDVCGFCIRYFVPTILLQKWFKNNVEDVSEALKRPIDQRSLKSKLK